MPRLTLDEVLADTDELLDVKAPADAPGSEEQRVLASFAEINRFITRFKRRPGETEKPSVSEQGLRIKLAGLLSNSDLHEALYPFDEHGLLPQMGVAEPNTLDEILELDDDLLDTSEDDIFNLVHTRPAAAKTDRVSERRICEDFDQYKPLFEQCVREINEGDRKTMQFRKEQEIDAGEFFILNGIMVYVAEVGETHIRNGKKNARLKLIFDNGTEGNNLLRSLATELYKDPKGRRISTPHAGPLFDDLVDEGDTQSGMIYVVKSLSEDPEIAKLDGLLHKIGFTSGKMEVRIQNAKDDPTFLMAPVHPVATFTLYNIDKVKLENLLHNFFSDARLMIEITDRFGKKVNPREWFLLPIEVIEEAIARLQDGSIVDYRYEADKGALVRNSGR
jgi:hypothetical protein